MAKLEPDRARLRASLDLSANDVDRLWDDIVSNYNPELRAITEQWESLGEKYRSLGDLSSD